MKAVHTPGPWETARDNSSFPGYLIRMADTPNRKAGYIAEVRAFTGQPEVDANARLIAAAPDLLAILEVILGAHDTKNSGAYMGEAVLCHHYAETARAAIAKAKGE